jgi:hypothetical protein
MSSQSVVHATQTTASVEWRELPSLTLQLVLLIVPRLCKLLLLQLLCKFPTSSLRRFPWKVAYNDSRTTTYTQTITTTLPVGMKRAAAAEGGLEARAAGTVPTYATYCHDAAAYSSACSCIGVTATTVIAPTQIVTAYAPDVTVDVCPNAGETNCGGTCFDLSESMNNCGACGNVVS